MRAQGLEMLESKAWKERLGGMDQVVAAIKAAQPDGKRSMVVTAWMRVKQLIRHPCCLQIYLPRRCCGPSRPSLGSRIATSRYCNSSPGALLHAEAHHRVWVQVVQKVCAAVEATATQAAYTSRRAASYVIAGLTERLGDIKTAMAATAALKALAEAAGLNFVSVQVCATFSHMCRSHGSVSVQWLTLLRIADGARCILAQEPESDCRCADVAGRCSE